MRPSSSTSIARPACAIAAATATGRRACTKRSKYSSRRIRSAATASPTRVMPRSGTESDSTWRSRAKAKVNVAVKAARTSFCSRSRYHSRMKRGDSVPVAICTTSTPIVTTKPISPIIAAAAADNTAFAVFSEYDHSGGKVIRPSSHRSTSVSTAPTTPPISGTTHRLCRTNWRARKWLPRTSSVAGRPCSGAAAPAHRRSPLDRGDMTCRRNPSHTRAPGTVLTPSA